MCLARYVRPKRAPKSAPTVYPGGIVFYRVVPSQGLHRSACGKTTPSSGLVVLKGRQKVVQIHNI
jgi:hypothetical protein